MALVLRARRVLLDEGWAEGRAVIVEGDRIAAVVRDDDTRARSGDLVDLGRATLVPGFVDTQVNGGGGVLFNDAPTVDAIRRIGAAHRRFGTTAFLPTLISDDAPVVARAIDAVREAMEARVPGVVGVHIEGPHISVDRKGVHDAAKFRALDAGGVELLASLGRGRTLVTLAPELADRETLRTLASRGVVLSAGHTDATCEQMQAAFADGVRGVTHLYNAMSPLHHRAPGVVGAALTDDAAFCALVVDGRHVHPVALRVALRCKPADRVMLVTDAMPPVGADTETFALQGRRIAVKDGVCVDEAGTLAGSALDMATAVRNCVRDLGVPLAQAVRMASTVPAAFLGLDGELGRIAPGHRACLAALDDDLRVTRTWIDGAE